MDNTAQLPVRVQLYWSSAEGQSRGVPAALVADMYCTNVMAHTIVHSWIDAAFISRKRSLFTLGDIMKLAVTDGGSIDDTYSDDTGSARVVIRRATSKD